MSKILHLTLKKNWFDMIASGEKTEEYREIKPYWIDRLEGKSFDVVQFKNGYQKDAPKVFMNLIGISKGYGKRKWGARGDLQYILHLGERLPTNNT